MEDMTDAMPRVLGDSSTVEGAGLVLTTKADRVRSAKEISAEIERLKVELRGAKQREKLSQSAEGKAAEAREKGGKEELARARKIGFNPEGPLHSEDSMAADIMALLRAEWDRNQGTWSKGPRLLFLSRTGWVAGQVGTRDWRPVTSVSEHIASVQFGSEGP